VYTENGHYYAKDQWGNLICVDSTTACLQEAIDAVKPGGGRVFIKKGTYPVTRTVTVSGNNIEIIGEYPTILGQPDFTFPILRILDANNVRVKGLIFDMQADWSYPRLPLPTANNIQLGNCRDVEIAYNILKNAREYSLAVGVYGENDIWTNRQCERVWIHHNLVSGGAADGIDIISGKHIIVENNIVTGTRDDAYAILAFAGEPVENVIMRNNVAYDHKFSCFKIALYYDGAGEYALNNVIIEGNYCKTTIDEGGGAVAIQYESNSVPPNGVGRNIYILNNIIYTGNVRFHAISITWFYRNAPNYTFKNIVIRGNYISAVNDPLDTSTSPPRLKDLYGIWVKDNTKINELVIENNTIERFRKGVNIGINNSAIIRNNVFRFNFEQAVTLWYSRNVEISNNYIYDNARQYLNNNTFTPYVVYLESVSDVVIKNNVFRAGESQTRCIGIFGNSSNILVTDNDMFNGYLLTPIYIDPSATNVILRRNRGVATENSGQATIPAGATSVTVNHGLICTPSKVLVTPLAQPPGPIWVSDITSSQFTINTSTLPTTDLPIAWYAEC
jgi:hypothetical protein